MMSALIYYIKKFYELEKMFVLSAQAFIRLGLTRYVVLISVS